MSYPVFIEAPITHACHMFWSPSRSAPCQSSRLRWLLEKQAVHLDANRDTLCQFHSGILEMRSCRLHTSVWHEGFKIRYHMHDLLILTSFSPGSPTDHQEMNLRWTFWNMNLSTLFMMRTAFSMFVLIKCFFYIMICHRIHITKMLPIEYWFNKPQLFNQTND